MDNGIYWQFPSPTSTASASASATGPVSHGDIVLDSGSLAEDLFKDKFMGVATGGSPGEKILRGFLIGVAIGLIVACFTCCWYPCCGGNRRRAAAARRAAMQRAQDEEEGNATTPATGAQGNQENQESQQTTGVQETLAVQEPQPNRTSQEMRERRPD